MLAVDSVGDVTPLEAPRHLPPGKLLERVRAVRNLKWAGEGARLYLETIRAAARPEGILLCDDAQEGDHHEGDCEGHWRLAAPAENLAAGVARLAQFRVRSGEVVKPEQLQALYVRASDAEIKTVSENG
jgi:hypothetical protein